MELYSIADGTLRVTRSMKGEIVEKRTLFFLALHAHLLPQSPNRQECCKVMEEMYTFRVVHRKYYHYQKRGAVFPWKLILFKLHLFITNF